MATMGTCDVYFAGKKIGRATNYQWAFPDEQPLKVLGSWGPETYSATISLEMNDPGGRQWRRFMRSLRPENRRRILRAVRVLESRARGDHRRWMHQAKTGRPFPLHTYPTFDRW